MKFLTTTMKRTLIPGAIALAVAMAYQSFGTRTAVLAEPTTTAVVDLKTLFDNLEVRDSANAELEEYATGLEDERQGYDEEVQALQADLEIFQPGSDKYREVEENLMFAALKLQAHTEYALQSIDSKKAQLRIKLYEDIRQASMKYADQNGIDIVLVDDSVAEMQMGTELQVRQQILARRVLYANDAIDITGVLTEWMNNEFRAGVADP